MDLRLGIIQTAESLGIDPVDLATAISYETGGTFDPLKRGPTTQWGQHRGLIQFGEPQARQHGVDWNDPLGSQLGPQGAVASYLRGAGVKPGMGLLDVYSAINAGAPGLYNRSDANNGGAPGTVRDKVEQQMDAHRRKAAALLGMEWTPPARPAATGGQPMADQGRMPVMSTQGMPAQAPEPERKGLFNPDVRDRLIIALEGMTLNPNTALMGQAAQGMKDRRDEKKEVRAANRTAEWLRSIGREDLAAAVMSGVIQGNAAASLALTPPKDESTALMKNYEFFIAQGMTPEQAMAAVRSGTTVNVGAATQSPIFGDPPDGTVWARDTAGQHIMEEGPGGVMRPKVVPLGGTEAEKRAGDAQARARQQETAQANAKDSIALIDSVLSDPALSQVTGMAAGRMPALTQGGTDLVVKIEQLQGQAFLQAFESLKGAGAITEREGEAARNAIARLQRVQSEEAFKAAVLELRNMLERGAANLRSNQGPGQGVSDDELLKMYGGQ